MLDSILGEKFSKLSHEKLSFFAFIWSLYASRIQNGGKKGNYYSVEMGNKFYTVDLKVTIKRVPTFEEKQQLKEMFGIDFEECDDDLKNAGILVEEKGNL